MTTTNTTTSGAADLLTLIEAYAEAFHRHGHSRYYAQTAAALQAVKDALAAGQATAAQAVVPAGWNLVPTEPTQAMLDAVVTSMDDFLLGKEAEKQYREDWAAMLAAAPAQPVAEQANADSVQEDAHALLQDVAACFTRDDDLPDNLLPRIDAVLAARKQGEKQ